MRRTDKSKLSMNLVYQEVVDKCSSRKLDLNVLIDLAVYYIIPVQPFPNWHLSVVSGKSRRDYHDEHPKLISWATFYHQASSAQSSFLMTPHRCLPMPQCHHCHTSESKLLDAWPWLQLHQSVDMGWWCHGLLVQSSSRIIASCIPENVWERQDY